MRIRRFYEDGQETIALFDDNGEYAGGAKTRSEELADLIESIPKLLEQMTALQTLVKKWEDLREVQFIGYDRRETLTNCINDVKEILEKSNNA